MSSFPERLIAGYQSFATHRLPTEQSRYRELAQQGQSPEVMVIGCCDSRVSPEVIFDVGRANCSCAHVPTWCRPSAGRRGARRLAALEFGCRCCTSSTCGAGECPAAASGARHRQRAAGAGRPSSASGCRCSSRRCRNGAPPRRGAAGFHHAAGEARGSTSLKNLMTFSACDSRRARQVHQHALFRLATGSLSVQTGDREFKPVEHRSLGKPISEASWPGIAVRRTASLRSPMSRPSTS